MTTNAMPRRMKMVSGILAVLAAIGAFALFSAPSDGFVGGLQPRAKLCVAPDEMDESLVARGDQFEGRRWRGSSRYKRYAGFVYKRKPLKGIRLRLQDFGTKHSPWYRIHAVYGKQLGAQSGRFLEICGWWDPTKEFDDPSSLYLKADRLVYWLRFGAQPTDQVASFLDLAGIIRRTGDNAKRGQWEWRIDPNSGPEAPEGWTYNLPHKVTWGNKPNVHLTKGKLGGRVETVRKIALIERYGFRGYTRIPVDEVALSDPLTKSPLLEAFPNTELPVYE